MCSHKSVPARPAQRFPHGPVCAGELRDVPSLPGAELSHALPGPYRLLENKLVPTVPALVAQEG